MALVAPAWAWGAQDDGALRSEAIVAAQHAMSSEAADALAKVSARFAEGANRVDCRTPEAADTALACLADAREGLVAQRAALQQQMETLYAATGSEGESRRASTRAALADLDARLAALDARIASRFPAYGELTNPAPMTIAEVQALLQPNEALVLVFVNPEATYVWGVSARQSAWARSSLGEAAMAEAVEALRRGLTSAAANRGSRADVVDFGSAASFDDAAAQRLYEELIRPIEAVVPKGESTLITVVSGPLRSVPLSLLRTGPGENAWLIDRYALASLPAVSSLKALRCHLAARPVAGCGTGAAARVAAARPTEASPKLVGFGAPALKGAPLERRSAGGDPAEVFSGRLADPAKLAQLAYLPGAERELRYLEEHVSGALIRRGPQATETAVRVGDRAALERARYVVFSTHGLLASSRALTIDGGSSVGEPGLVLTPPATATEGDDGYLSASEAAQLRLSAEFVVLSACNTAASDGRPGGEGLSGLARAFFYAGARSLLVSHWEVSDEATTQLITAAFTGLDRQGASGRAAALRAAIRTVRARPGFSHPYYWAPFELVGEPAGDAGR